MQAYPNSRPAGNPTHVGQLLAAAMQPAPPATARQRTLELGMVIVYQRTRRRLEDWATNALAAMKPERQTLRTRWARAWNRNGRYVNGVHSKERGRRESDLAGNLERFKNLQGGAAILNLPLRLRAPGLAVVYQLERLFHAGDWWKPKPRVDRTTGELLEAPYLPEDTWSAESMVDWCVSFLARLVASAWRLTEKSTPTYTTVEAESSPQRKLRSKNDLAWLDRARARWCGPPGEQPELPATS